MICAVKHSYINIASRKSVFNRKSESRFSYNDQPNKNFHNTAETPHPANHFKKKILSNEFELNTIDKRPKKVDAIQIPKIRQSAIETAPPLNATKNKFQSVLEETIKKQPANPGKREKQYAGPEIAIGLDAVDIRSALSLLSQVCGKDFFVADDVKAIITVNLEKPEPWDKIFQKILDDYQLDASFHANAIHVFNKKNN